jgi:hypothetical protein
MVLDTISYRFYSNQSVSNRDIKENTPQKVSEDQIIYTSLFLTLKMPRIENFDVYKNCYIWQHVITVGVFLTYIINKHSWGILSSHVISWSVEKITVGPRQHSHS